MKPHFPRLKSSGKNTPDKDTQRTGLDLQRTLLAAATTVILSALLSLHLVPSKVHMRVGDTAPKDIYAHRGARYKDVAETELRKSQAADNVGRFYSPAPNAADQSVGALKTFFHAIETVRVAYPGLPLRERIGRVRAELGSLMGTEISDPTCRLLLSVDSAYLREMEDASLRIVSAAMGREIRDDINALTAAKASVATEALKLLDRPEFASAVSEVARAAVRPNRIYDAERTRVLQERAQEQAQPAYRLVMPGELVIAKGEQVLQEHIEKFEALGLRNPMIDFRSVLSMSLFVIVVVLLMVGYLSTYHHHVYASNKALLLLAIIVVLSTLALRLGGSVLGVKLSLEQVGYLGLLWIMTSSMLISVLLNPHIAVVACALLSLVLSMLLNSELRFASTGLISGLVGIYSVANIRDRNDLMRAAGLLGATGVLLAWIMGGINNDPFPKVMQASVWALATACAATWLFMLGTWLLERPFRATTHLSLLELADTNRPLLRRLQLEAPGTYGHSMIVGHLAETAAEAAEADSLVARVSSYYHDIGKIKRPHFFIENQPMENVHDRMNPTLSALVITSHIKDGIDTARQFRLPRVVQDVIAQHHGTSLVQYFYNQYAGEQDPSVALEQQFRYSGPKPQTREAAIVMLADSVEAASRCLSKPTPAKIELMVNRVIADKMRDGQLDECDLTFKEVSKISDSFTRALVAMMHARIEYIEAVTAENGKPTTNGDSDTELAEDTGQASTDQESGTTLAAG